jgi:hypothetical protein
MNHQEAVTLCRPAEEWRTIAGFPLYEVSSLGRIRSWHKGQGPRILRPGPDDKGYLTAVLFGPNGRATRKVHRLVAEAFLGPKPKGLQTRHLDSNNQNNAAINLAYGTQLENMADRVALKQNCKNGHPFEGDNLYFPTQGGRGCRTCARAADRRRREKAAS